MWTGWGFIASISSHALGLNKKIGCQLQKLFDFIVVLLKGKNKAKRHKFKTSGSLGICARKVKDLM